LDLVIRYGNHHMFSLLLGNPGGTFQAPKNYVAPGDNSSLAILPLASSQLLVMLMDRITQDMVVYIAPGNGTILAPAMGKLNDSITAIGSGDFDGDADQDLLFGMANNQIVLQRNAGGGVLQAQAPVTLSGRPTGAVTADLNGDGRADGIFTLRSGNAAVLLGNANGTFGTATPFAAGSSPSHPQLADFNKDGKPDLAVIPELFGGGAGQASVLLGNGQGGFGSPVTLATNAGDLTGLTTGDFNGDQNPDIVVTTATGGGNGTGNIAFFRGNGNGTFQNAVTTPLVSSYALAGGDFDRDGKLDLAIVLNSNTIQIVLGNGNGTWRSGSTIAVLTTGTDLQALDLNRDGNPDLINDACCGEVRTTYLVGYGNGTFGPEEAIEAPNSPAPIAMADLNGDAWLDIALGGNGGFYTVQQMRFPALLVVNSASGRFGVAPDSIASGYGSWPTMQANPVGSTVTVKDSAGVTRDSFIYYSSPSLVNFTIPAGTALGESTVTVHAGGGVTSSTKVAITNVAPALYMINGDRLVAARVIRVSGGTTSREEVFQLVNGAIVTKPVSLGPATDEVFLELYGTGLRAAGKAGTIVTIGGVVVPIEYAGAQGAPGFDQVNVKLPRSLVGKGAVELILTAGDKKANTVTLTIQ
jgi:uncharacterized protein (TIGR03437 family)